MRLPLLEPTLAILAALTALYLTILYLMYTQLHSLARRAHVPYPNMKSLLDYSDSYWFVCVYVWHSAIADYDNAYLDYYYDTR